MRIVLFLFVAFFVISCKKEESLEKKCMSYVISEERRKYEDQDERFKRGEIDKVILVNLPKYLYATENFILDDSSNVYYYQLERFYSAVGCGTGMDEEIERDSIPVFKNLKPEKIIQIPINSIDEFVKLNLRNGERNLVKIASQKDTLNSKSYFKLINAFGKYLNFREDHDSYLIYRTTQEEDTVLFFKKNIKEYYSDSIMWDRKRIKFLKPKS